MHAHIICRSSCTSNDCARARTHELTQITQITHRETTYHTSHRPIHKHVHTHTRARVQFLSLRDVLAVVGKEEWGAIGERKFPVRILVAGRTSACRPDNVQGMVAMVPRARVVHFPKAYHSIHNSRTRDFVKAIKDVYEELDRIE